MIAIVTLIVLPMVVFGVIWSLRLATLERGDDVPFLAPQVYFFFWLVALLGVAISLAFLIGIVGAIVWCVMLIVITLSVVSRSRMIQASAMFQFLGKIAQLGLPLAAAVSAYGSETGGSIGRRAERLAKLLEAGTPLRPALRKCRLRLPVEQEIAVSFADDSQLMARLLSEDANRTEPIRQIWRNAFEYLIYGLFVSLSITCIYTFFMLKFLPTFQQIAMDFGLVPTEGQRMSLGAMKVIYWGMIWIVPWGLLLGLAGTAIYIGWLPVDLPVLARVSRRLNRARIFRALAVATGHGANLPDVLSRLAYTYPSAHVKRKLQHVREAIVAGSPWLDSFQREGLIDRTEYRVLQAADRNNHLSWALSAMAERNERRTEIFWSRLLRVAVPVGILLLAIPPLSLGYYVFQVLSQAVYGLT